MNDVRGVSTVRSATVNRRTAEAARTRSRLIDAALAEFSEKGYAGARVREISDRAGVSKDLIGYHFGGKAGLYAAVQQEWLDQQTSVEADLPLVESVLGYLDRALADPRPTRLLVWRGLRDEAPDSAASSVDLTITQSRVEAGEVAPDLDAATLRLVLTAIAAAPIAFPTVARSAFGVPVDSDEFRNRYRAGVASLVARLTAPQVVTSA